MIFKFDVKPQQQDRPRIGKKNAFNKEKGYYFSKPYLFDPKRVVEYKKVIGMLARQQCRLNKFNKFTGAVLCVDMTFVLKMPTSFSKKKREEALRRELLPGKKPDLSNYVKSTEDALNGIVWQDDACICKHTNMKVFGEKEQVIVDVKVINWNTY